MHPQYPSRSLKGCSSLAGSFSCGVMGERKSSLRGLQGSLDYRSSLLWIFDFHDQALVSFVLQLQHDGSLGVVNVVKDDPTLLVKRASSQEAGNIGSHDPQAVPPPARRLGIDLNRANVRDRNVEVTPERPKLVEALDVQVN